MANLFRWIRISSPLIIILVFAFLTGCGGGGETSEQGLAGGGGTDLFPAKILSWSPPSQYMDGTTLNPETDLDRYEIYINEDGIFSDIDNEMAVVTATDPVTGQLMTYFDLSNLAPFFSKGVIYYVSIRAVASDGIKSNFSPYATFSY